MIEFRGAAQRLRDDDLPRVGAIIGVGEDEIHAVIDVEAAGSGFDKLGRPKMLFEPHLFWRNLPPARRDEASRRGVAYPAWRRSYPPDSYPRLEIAMTIDETAALKSSSWGLGQVLGEHHARLGYPTVQGMVIAFTQSEAAQLEGMVRFIQSAGLDRHLRAHNWAAFAFGYNGAGYRLNAYDTKLAASYARWSRIKDTPYRAIGGADEWRDDKAPMPKPEPALGVAPPDQSGPQLTPAQKGGIGTVVAGWVAGVWAFVLDHPWATAGASIAAGLLIYAIIKSRKDR